MPVIAAMITALAFSFTGLPMDGNTSVEKMSDVYNGLGCTSLLAWILLLILYVKGWEGYRKYKKLAGTCFGSDSFRRECFLELLILQMETGIFCLAQRNRS